MSEKYILKILTLGSTSVGKTSIILRYTEDKFKTNKPTLGIDYKIKIIKRGGESIKVYLYDTASLERFQSIVKNYYRGSDGIFLIYDITNRKSFEQLDSWYKDLEDNLNNLDEVFICLIGNKNDLEDKRVVTKEEGKKYADGKNIPFFEVSAKTSNGIINIFNEMLKGAMRKLYIDNNKRKENFSLSFLDKPEDDAQKDKKCC